MGHPTVAGKLATCPAHFSYLADWIAASNAAVAISQKPKAEALAC
jgi:hypothetical protein